MTRYGQEGIDYKKDGKKIEVNKDNYKKNVVDNGNFLEIYGWFTPRKPEVFGFNIIDPNITDRDKKIVEKIRSYKINPSVGTALTVKEGMDIGALRKQMSVFHTQILFKEKDASKWAEYRQEVMNKYGGKAIFENYAALTSTAQGKTITFKAEN